MFEHLDDPQPPRSGTEMQIGAARRGGRVLIRDRRRHRVAAGSAALAATAGVSAVAAVGLPGGGAGAAPLTAVADTPDATTPSAAAVPSSSAPQSTAAAASPSPTGAATSTTTAPTAPPPTTAACTHEAARLRTSVEPDGYLPTDPGDAVIAWTHPGGPLTKLVVSVRCAPFSAADVPPADGPVREVTVLDTHHWLIGSASAGHLQEVWNADNGTAVVIDATVQSPAAEAAAEQQLSTFGNCLID
jgi:hypothetical protein